MVDFNKNLLIYDTDESALKFLDLMYVHDFLPISQNLLA